MSNECDLGQKATEQVKSRHLCTFESSLRSYRYRSHEYQDGKLQVKGKRPVMEVRAFNFCLLSPVNKCQGFFSYGDAFDMGAVGFVHKDEEGTGGNLVGVEGS